MNTPSHPPHTTISLPVQTAAWRSRPVGAPAIEVGVHESTQSHYMDSAWAYTDSPQQSVSLAETAARQAIAIDDKDATAHSALGSVFAARGDFGAAIAQHRAALELNPSHAGAHLGMGLALLLDGQAVEAVPEFEMAARLSPHDPNMWLFETLGAGARIMLSQFEAAERLARSATRRPGAGFWTYAALASALGNLGRIEEARPVLEKLVELKPDFSPEFFETVWIGVHPSVMTLYFEGLRNAGLDFPDEPAGTGD